MRFWEVLRSYHEWQADLVTLALFIIGGMVAMRGAARAQAYAFASFCAVLAAMSVVTLALFIGTAAWESGSQHVLWSTCVVLPVCGWFAVKAVRLFRLSEPRKSYS